MNEKTEKNLDHLAIVPDGNRRWAKQHGLIGEDNVYKKGSDATYEIVRQAFESDISYVTFWASSYSNLLKRPKPLVNAIEAVFAQTFHDLTTHPLIHDHQVRIEVYGEWREVLKPKTIKSIEESISATRQYSGRQLTVLIGYDGQRERGAAILQLLHDAKSGSLDFEKDDIKQAANLLRHYSWTGGLPDVDLILRTGSWKDPHNSAGFLSLISNDAQYAFPEVLWPDLSADMLKTIILDFTGRERRMGR